LRFWYTCLFLPLALWHSEIPADGKRDDAERRQPATTAAAPYVEQIPGTTVKFEMVHIAGGKFMMGSPADEAGREADEGPQHEVTVRPFWIGRFEVTWDEYDQFAFGSEAGSPAQPAATPPAGADAVTRPTPPYGDESFGYGKGRQPAIDMAYHAAREYTRWLSAVTGKAYRLPTEAEWEFAARGGSTGPYSFDGGAANLDAHAWYSANSDERPHQVGQKKPNKFGLHDMHGNVAEWCLDQYDPKAYAQRAGGPPVLSPVVLPGAGRYPHVARGGSWADDARRLRSAARRGSTESWSRRDPQSPQSIWWHTDATFVGFRVARAVEEQPELRDLRSKITKESPDR
jgi:formylglycine-generating enzyme required for sulfatase activity